MGNYRIFETGTFQQDLARLGRSGLHKIKAKLQAHIYPQLRVEPRFGPNIKRLKQWTPPTWRYRVGAWRFFCEINEQEQIVYMTAADHRSRMHR